MTRQHVHYYLKKLEKAGLVKRTGPRWPAFYEITETCKKFLTGCEGLKPSFVFRLHNCVFKYPILEEPVQPVDWRRVEKMNWSSLIGSELGLTVEQTTRHVLVYCDAVEGRDPSMRAHETCHNTCYNNYVSNFNFYNARDNFELSLS
jgi:hypothetical protein